MGNPTDRTILWKLLNRVYATKNTSGADEMRNMRLDDEATSLTKWESSLLGKVINSADTLWRVPLYGSLEFDFYTANPQTVAAQHFKLDLSESKDRKTALELYVRAQNGGGECWWNETLNGYPFDLPEKSSNYQFAHRGILEFDFVILRSSAAASSMETTHYTFCLSNKAEYIHAELLRLFMLKNPNENMWVNGVLKHNNYTAFNACLPVKVGT